MSFTNLYYKRTAGTEKACFVCYKPTTTVLATINTVDFVYTCPGHLKDPGFASAVGESNDGASGARKMGLSPEEIAKVKEEWEEKQKKKLEKEKLAKEKEKAEKEKNKDKDDNKDEESKDKGKDKKASTKLPGSLSPTPPVTPTHERETEAKHDTVRLSEHRKRRQAAQAKALAPKLPAAPSGSVYNPPAEDKY